MFQKSHVARFYCSIIVIQVDKSSKMTQANDAAGFENFLAFHEPQLRASGVPDHLFKSVCNKLHYQIFDAGEFFQLLLLDYGDDGRDEKDPVFTVVAIKDIKADDPNAVFLIDHSLTFKSDILRKQLMESPSIVNRLSIMMGLSVNDNVEKVMENIWRFTNFYSINAQGEKFDKQFITVLQFICFLGATVEDSLPLWYVMDELGSGIVHGDEPNCRIIPFIYAAEQVTYSLLFPIRDINEGDRVTRDYVEGTQFDRELVLLPWRDNDFTDEPIEQCEPETSYFLHGRIEESLPEVAVFPVIDANRPLKVLLINFFIDYN